MQLELALRISIVDVAITWNGSILFACACTAEGARIYRSEIEEPLNNTDGPIIRKPIHIASAGRLRLQKIAISQDGDLVAVAGTKISEYGDNTLHVRVYRASGANNTRWESFPEVIIGTSDVYS